MKKNHQDVFENVWTSYKLSVIINQFLLLLLLVFNVGTSENRAYVRQLMESAIH